MLNLRYEEMELKFKKVQEEMKKNQQDTAEVIEAAEELDKEVQEKESLR